MIEKAEERTLWRLRLLVARAAQDCGVMRHELFELGAIVDGVLETSRLSSQDLSRLQKLSAAISRCAEDCHRNEHCEFVRADLICELRELHERLKASVFDGSHSFAGAGRT